MDVRHSEDSVSSPHGSADALRLGDLVDVTLWKSMMDDFYALTHMPMALIDLDGTVVVGAGWQDACTRFHRAHPDACAHCIESDTVLAADIPAGEVRIYRCKNGMWDAATPILVGDRRVGNLFTGQFFFDDESVDWDFFQAQAHRYGFDERQYLAAIESVPRLGRTTVDTGLRFLTKLASMISQLTFSNQERARAELEAQAALSRQIALAEDLAAERGILQAIMDNTDTALAYLDPEFNFVAVNTAYASGAGYERADLVGRYHFALFPNPENESIFKRARESGEPIEFREKPFEFAGQPWRGVTYWDWRLTPVTERDGSLKGFAFSLLDVTRGVRQRAFSEAINRLNDVIHSDLDFGGIITQILPELAAASGSEVVATALRTPDGLWTLEAAFGLPDEVLGRTFGDEQFPAAAQAITAERPVIAAQADGAQPVGGFTGDLGIRSLLVVPLSASGRQFGVVAYGYLSGPGEFDEHAIDFAGKTAASLSLALNNSRLFHDAMHAARLSGALAKVDEILLAALTTEDVVAGLVGEVSEAAGADKSLVIKVHEDEYTITHVRGVSEGLIGTPRTASYFPAFSLAAVRSAPVLVEDAWNDPRTNKEFVVPNDLRAFQLLPLSTQGSVTNVLALAYANPQSFDEEDYRSAERMAAAMSFALNNARLYENEHLVADRLQEALLALPDKIEGLEFAHAYHSASDAARVGGDFYDVFELDDHRVGVTIGDVAGKGLDAAVLTSLAKNTIRAHTSERGKTPSQILALTNDVVFRGTPWESFVTVFLGILDRRDGRLVYASAGHPVALLRSGRTLAELPATGSLLGAFEGAVFGEAEVDLDLDDALFLYTDGLTEARGDGEFYGDVRMYEVLLQNTGDRSATSLVEDVITDVLAFSGGRLRDDLAILAVRRPRTPVEALET